MQKLTLCSLIFFIAITSVFAELSVDDIQIRLAAEKPHKYAFSNKKAAFWYGETQQQNINSFQGYTILEQRYLKDYTLILDGKTVDRTTADEIILHPDGIERKYPAFSERLYVIDSLNILLIEITPQEKIKMGVLQNFENGLITAKWNWDETRRLNYTANISFGINKPTFFATTVIGNAENVAPSYLLKKNEAPNGQPGIGLKFVTSEKIYVATIFGKSLPELYRLKEQLQQPEKLIEIRKKRIQKLINGSQFQSGDVKMDQAYLWALISMDDLVTEQRGKGIWAGLPWFNNYWGRDSFISFTGALLCSGQFELAKDVLQSFSKFQNHDRVSKNYGRIPNRVKLSEIIYNTTDGTPWFVKACEDYINYSGDLIFMEQMFPVLHQAIEGALIHHVDENGFLKHADADTWMDAVGSDGPWSPRGDRAVEIQALWLEQIRISAKWAQYLGFSDLSRKWLKTYQKVKRNFAKHFWNEETKYLNDHLNADGSIDLSLRPNQIFALTVPKVPMLSSLQAASVVRECVNKLVYPWGVGSLWQGEPKFHPYHHYEPHYVPDAAYHNGIVWTWVSGPMISAMYPYNPDLAYELLENEAMQILEKDAIGGYSELLEAWPREGTQFPRISGTVTQAWNLAEFIRNLQQDVAGIRPAAISDSLFISYNPVKTLSDLNTVFAYKNGSILYRLKKENNSRKIILKKNAGILPATINVQLKYFSSDKEGLIVAQQWDTGQELIIEAGEDSKIKINNASAKVKRKFPVNRLTDLKFCQPRTDLKLAVLSGGSHELIKPEEATRKPGRLTRKLFDVNDASGDDRGAEASYIYPTHSAFEPGIFDILSAKVWKDDQYYYFRLDFANLVNPGWRPESGYQLTYAAIALNFGAKAGIRRTRIDMNAHHTIPFEYAYNFILFVGNGYRIMNTQNEIIAEYRPHDNNHPMGFVDKKCIQFAVPARYLPDINLENGYIMVGGQDDHGAGGVGEFRTVSNTSGEWQGAGGKKESGNSSVYDELEIR